MNKQQSILKLMFGGKQIEVRARLHDAHGVGLDGRTPVRSLKIGLHPDHPGKILGQDSQGNAFVTTADEMFVALQEAAPQYKITATKIS